MEGGRQEKRERETGDDRPREMAKPPSPSPSPKLKTPSSGRTKTTFHRLLQSGRICRELCDVLLREDSCRLRAASRRCRDGLTPHIFRRLHITFTASSFTKQTRLLALARVGQHVEHLTFSFAHTGGTFLPPLIHRSDGHEIGFLYSPHTSVASPASRPKYSNVKFAALLTEQYPPLFHAATNTPSFIQAFRCLPNLCRLAIRCPNQDPRERYRRSIVDYALISLRVALERASLHRLYSLSLDPVHPSALHYLRHMPAFGSTPAAARLWRQIRSLRLAVDSWDFYGPDPGRDNLCIIDDFVRALAPNLEKLSFEWKGRLGPCPIALSGHALFPATTTPATPARTCSVDKAASSLFEPYPQLTQPVSEAASSSQPLLFSRRPIHMPRLRYLLICNSTMNARQIADLVAAHRSTVKTFDFQHIELCGPGTVEDALAPLNHSSPSSPDSSPSLNSSPSSTSGRRRRRQGSPEPSPTWSQLPLPHPATNPPVSVSPCRVTGHNELRPPSSPSTVRAASRELLVIGIDPGLGVGIRPGIHTSDADQQDNVDNLQRGSIDSGRRDSAVAFSTRMTRYRPDQRHLHKRDDRARGDGASHGDLRSKANETRPDSHEHSDKIRKFDEQDRDRYEPADEGGPRRRELRRYDSADSHSSSSTVKSRSDTSALSAQSSPRRHVSPTKFIKSTKSKSSGQESGREPSPHPTKPSAPDQPGQSITPPLIPRLIPQLALLQPTVYSKSSGGRGNYGGPGAADPAISAVQRNLEQEEAHRLLAEDVDLRTSALRKAKEAVLAKMAQEFRRRGAAKRAAAGGRNGGHGRGCASSFTYSARFREGLFAESTITVIPDKCLLESQTALVPLMFTRP